MTIYKKFRINNEWTQEKMAEKLEISVNAYRNYENGERVMPCQVLSKFLQMTNNNNYKALGRLLEEILEGKENEKI